MEKKWIAVADQPPPTDRDVLCAHEAGLIRIQCCWERGHLDASVTHWMSLPDIPQDNKHIPEDYKKALEQSFAKRQPTVSWFTGFCGSCGFPVVVTQPNEFTNPHDDYQWYCSNRACPDHHTESSHTGDLEHPPWVDMSQPGKPNKHIPEDYKKRLEAAGLNLPWQRIPNAMAIADKHCLALIAQAGGGTVNDDHVEMSEAQLAFIIQACNSYHRRALLMEQAAEEMRYDSACINCNCEECDTRANCIPRQIQEELKGGE